MKYPRVLVIAPIKFNQQAGGGVTMGNLFRGWPLDAIAQIHSDFTSEPDYTVCTNYFFIQGSSIEFTFHPRAMGSLMLRILNFITGRQDALGYWFRWEKMLRWVRQFAPDIIYTRPLDYFPFYWWLPRELAIELGIPYVTHFMDDWPARYENNQGLMEKKIWIPLMQRNLHSLFEMAAANIGISVEMCEAYQKRYGCQFVPFHNNINPSEWSHIKKDYNIKNKFYLAYIGAVTEDKELHSLMDIRNVVLSLSQQGYSIRMIIYSAPSWKHIIQKHLECPPWVVYGGYINPNDLPEVLSRSDLLILPINFDKISLTYVGYSFQTKVPEYMASGTPVLVYGPSTNPNVQYAIREGWGIVVDQPDKTKLHKAIIELMEDTDMRTELGQHARTLAFRNHNSMIIRQQFNQLINEVAFDTNKECDKK